MPVVSGGALFDAYRRIPSPLLWRCLILLEWSSYQVGAGALEYGCLSLSRNARVLEPYPALFDVAAQMVYRTLRIPGPTPGICRVLPRYIDLEHLLILTMRLVDPGRVV